MYEKALSRYAFMNLSLSVTEPMCQAFMIRTLQSYCRLNNAVIMPL